MLCGWLRHGVWPDHDPGVNVKLPSPVASLYLLLSPVLASCGPGDTAWSADDPDPSVWANIQTGIYHCEGSQFYEATAEGQLALESEARGKGYRPSNDILCGDGTVVPVENAFGEVSEAEELPQYQGPEVWVNTGSGVYHCPSSAYYRATDAGEMVSEREALAAGYLPSGGRACP